MKQAQRTDLIAKSEGTTGWEIVAIKAANWRYWTLTLREPKKARLADVFLITIPLVGSHACRCSELDACFAKHQVRVETEQQGDEIVCSFERPTAASRGRQKPKLEQKN